MQEYEEEMILEQTLESILKFIMTQPICNVQKYWNDIMSYCVNEIKENLSTYNVDEDLYKHKLRAYAQAFFQFIYMTFH